MFVEYKSSQPLRVHRCRRDRVILAHHPHHVVQRSRYRSRVFGDDGDYQAYVSSLMSGRNALDLKVYGYCLMANHIHLIVDPGDTPANIPLLMQHLASRNGFDRRAFKGFVRAAWDEYKCMPIESDRHMFTCARYVDLNPVRAAMVDNPEDYRWSSYRARAGLIRDSWLDNDPAYFSLSERVHERQDRYRQFVEAELPRRKLQSLCNDLKKIHSSKVAH